MNKQNPANDPLIGQTLMKRYRILGKIGEGGMGSVYKAHQTFMDQTVALKVIRPELGRDRNFRERFLMEVKNASRVRHPNAVQILDAGESEEGLVYMAMEFVEGESLTEVIEQHTSGMPLWLFRKLAGQMCAALAAVHEKGIIHRDLKPDNILVQDSSAGPQIKLLDFGIARAQGDSRMTQTGMIIGTPEFLSPEQAGGEPMDHRSDLYTLGLIFYLMLTGRAPYQSETPGGYLYKHVNEAPPKPTKFRKDLPAGLEQAILKALEKKPAKRYASADELREALEKVLGNVKTGTIQKEVKKTQLAGTEVVDPETLVQPDKQRKNTHKPARRFSLPSFSWVGGLLMFLWVGYKIYMGFIYEPPALPTAVDPGKLVQQMATNNSYRNLVSAGDNLFNQGNYQDARDKYTAALQVKPLDSYAMAQQKACDEKLAAAQTSTTGLKSLAPPASNMLKSINFLSENGRKPGVVTLPSGLQYKVLRQGSGRSPQSNETISLHFKGSLSDGTPLWNTYDGNQPTEGTPASFVPGFKEALERMQPGALWEVYIPPQLGYGNQEGSSGKIPPNSVMIFQIELLEIR